MLSTKTEQGIELVKFQWLIGCTSIKVNKIYIIIFLFEYKICREKKTSIVFIFPVSLYNYQQFLFMIFNVSRELFNLRKSAADLGINFRGCAK